MIDLLLHIVIIVGIIFVILLLGLLFVPFDYNVEGDVNESVYGVGNIKWLFGLTRFNVYKGKEDSKVKVKFNFCGFKLPVSRGKKSNIKHKDKKKNTKKSSNRRVKITKQLINICYKYFKDIVNIVKPRYINISGIYGFDDPSITGIVCGVISIINSVIPNTAINVEPEFEEELYDIEIKANGRIIGCIILCRTLKFIINKEVRKNIFSKKEKNVKLSKV